MNCAVSAPGRHSTRRSPSPACLKRARTPPPTASRSSPPTMSVWVSASTPASSLLVASSPVQLPDWSGATSSRGAASNAGAGGRGDRPGTRRGAACRGGHGDPDGARRRRHVLCDAPRPTAPPTSGRDARNQPPATTAAMVAPKALRAGVLPTNRGCDDRHRQCDPAVAACTVATPSRTEADKASDRGCHRDRVVRVHHAVHEAEHRRGDQQPAATRQCRHLAAAQPAAHDQIRAEADDEQRGRQKPGDLVAHLRGEQALEPGPPRSTSGRIVGAAPSAADSGRSAQDAGHARCSRRPDASRCCRSTRRCRAARSRARLDRQHPPARAATIAHRSAENMEQTPSPTDRRQQQIRHRECGQYKEALQHLGQKRCAHSDSDQREPAPRCRLDGADQAVTCDVNSRTSSASGLLKRKIKAAAGVHASAAPASRPATMPGCGSWNVRRTVA